MATADLVLANGKICTVDRRFSFQQAVAVKDGWIIEVSDDDTVRPLIGPGTVVVDLRGRLLLPGAQDCHTHAAFGGMYWGEDYVDVYGLRSRAEVLDRFAAAAARTPPGRWILGGGMNRTLQGDGKPLTRHDLDGVSPHHPVMLSDSGLHGLLLNSRGLAVCGIRRDTPDLDPSTGYFERDADGEPTGYLREFAAQAAATRQLRLFSDEEMDACVLRAQAHLNRYGITTHTDMIGPGGDALFCGTWGTGAIEAYERMAAAGRLTARCAVNVLAGLDGVQSYDAVVGGLERLKLPEFRDRNWVRADAVKLFGDAGWRRKNEAMPGREGHCTFPGQTEAEQAAELTRTIVEVHRRGWQIGIHLTGGAGIDAAIAAFQQAQRLHPGPSKRHFIIHGDELSAANIRDCAGHRILLSAQAIAPYSFMEEVVEALRPGLGEGLFDFRGYLEAGMTVAQGSDAPTMSANWLKGLQFMLTRRCRAGRAYRPELACSLEQGLRMYTIHGAVQNHMENVSGSVEVGKLADFQVLGEDIFRVDPGEVGEVPVEMTVCSGRIVYGA